MTGKYKIIDKYWVNPLDISSAGKVTKSISKMMDEYAKESVIEFFKWNVRKQAEFSRYVIHNLSKPNEKDIDMEIYTFENSTIEERYNLFIKSIEK